MSSTDPDVRLGDLALGAARFVPRWPRVAHALLTVLRSDPSVATSMGARVERNARRHRDHTALLFEHQQWTWRELNAAANRWAHTLTARGIRRGDCVALLVESRPELLFALVALAKIGAHAGLLNTTLRGDPLKHSLKVLGARTVVVGAELLGVSAVVRRAVPGPPLFVGDDASDGVGCPVGWVDLVEEARWAPVHNPRSTGLVTLGDRVFTIPTSGTTGLPKASVMSHMRWEKAADTAGRIFLDLHPGDVVYVPLPFFHNMALSIGWGAVVSTGAALLMRRRLSVSAFWDDCRRHGVTAFPYIGELLPVATTRGNPVIIAEHPRRSPGSTAVPVRTSRKEGGAPEERGRRGRRGRHPLGGRRWGLGAGLRWVRLQPDPRHLRPGGPRRVRRTGAEPSGRGTGRRRGGRPRRCRAGRVGALPRDTR